MTKQEMKGTMNEQLRISASSRFYTVHPEGRFTPPEMVEYFRATGFRGIDFDIETVPAMGEDWKRILGETADLAAKYDICMNFGHLPFAKIRRPDGTEDKEQFMKNTLLCLEASGFAGIRYAVIHPIGSPKGNPEEDEKNFQKNVEYFTPLAEYAQKCGVRLAFENMRSPWEGQGYHRYGSTAREILRLADYFGMDCCWDFGHAHTSRLCQSEELRLLKGRLTVLHVNDNHGELDEHLIPFLGTIDWADAMAGLKDADFHGCFNFECRTIHIPAHLRAEIGAYAIAVGQTLTKMLL